MTDTTFESLIKAAADAQSAREGEAYTSAQTELSQIDTDILAKQLRRDQLVAMLEAFDTDIEAATDAVRRYVRAERDDVLFAEITDGYTAPASSSQLLRATEDEPSELFIRPISEN